MSKVYLDPAAEREANDVGKKFMHSSDVVGDMSRAYGTDLSGVRLHTDGAAAQKAAQRGVDAFSTGGDIFFGHGTFDRNDPASQGLLAHELSHSLQQGFGEQGGVSQSAPMGAEQGGLLDFFRGLFGKKRTPAQEDWDREKQKRLDALDAQDAMAADWKRQTAEENDAVRSAHAKGITGAPKLPTYTDENTSELNLSELLGKAKELGWKKFNSQGGEDQEFNLGIMENFFREASGSSLKAVETDPASGDTKKRVYTGKRSLGAMMDVFLKHDEESTLHFLEPLMNFSVKDYTEKFPLQKMSILERQEVWPELITYTDKLIGIKQWGEKYGYTLLSEANRKKFDEQTLKFMSVSNWFINIYGPGQTTSIAQKYELDMKHKDKPGKFYEYNLQDKQKEIMGDMGADGEVIPFAQFASLMSKLMPKYGDKALKIRFLGRNIPGLAYDAAADAVVSPVPLADLEGLSKGKKSTLNKFADKMRTMNWRDENGKERRAGQYNTDTEAFLQDFDSDYRYFGDMNTTAYLLSQFGGGKYVRRQKDSGDLSDRMALAQSTFQMMGLRAGALNSETSTLYYEQFGQNSVKPTWIKRQLLESSVMVNGGPQEGAWGKSFYSSQGKAVGEMIANAQKMNPELLKDPKMREMALKGFQQGFGNMLAEYDNKDFTAMTSAAFRGNASGELAAYNTVLKANSGDLMADLTAHIAGKEVSAGRVDECLDIICDHILDTGSSLHEMVLGGIKAVERSAHFQGKPEMQSKYLMNNVVLRVVAPQLSLVNLQLANKLMAAVNSGTSAASERLRGLLAG